MKTLIPILFLLLNFTCRAQTQAEMNHEAFDLYKNADKELNEMYDEILIAYAEDEIFISNLKKAQNLWIQFRDAELSMKFPNYPDNHFGSLLPMCKAYFLKELTEERTESLSAWLDTKEPDPCNHGSVKDQ